MRKMLIATVATTVLIIAGLAAVAQPGDGRRNERSGAGEASQSRDDGARGQRDTRGAATRREGGREDRTLRQSRNPESRSESIGQAQVSGPQERSRREGLFRR